MLSLLASTSASAAYAQAVSGGVLAGRITGADSVPIVSATVTLEGTPLQAITDERGRYRIAGIPPGPQVILVRRIGYAPARHPVLIAGQGTVTVNLRLATSALHLPGLILTADPVSRARGELGTASVISEEAIRNQAAASLTGVLELVPGTLLQPPGLDGVQQFALRAVPVGAASSPSLGRAFSPSASLLASFGTQIVLDGVPASNNVNMQNLGHRAELAFATAAGGGIDLRRIPAATIERVEVIRGLPSSRFGDVTAGVVLVETRAGAVDPEVRVRLDARTVEATVLGGKDFTAGQSASATFNLARTRLSPGFRDNVGTRISAQLAHRAETRRLVFDTRFDGFQVLDDAPESPVAPDVASRSRDNGIRIAERVRWDLGRRRRIDGTASFELIRQRSFSQAPFVRGAMPFTNRTTEGMQEGKFVGGIDVGRAEVSGHPRHFYTRIESRAPLAWAGVQQEIRAGSELRREWNSGPGYQFDIEFPPQVTFNGVNGYDRPRAFDSIPPLVTSALYLDSRLARTFVNGWTLSVQAGARLDQLHSGSSWISHARDRLLQPRLQLELSPTRWLRLRGGSGRLSKVPALSDLFPAAQYYDLVNFNWYANDSSERRAILTTRIRQRTNSNLRMSRAEKHEVAVEVDVGGGNQVALTAYLDRTRGAVGVSLEPDFLLREKFSVDSSTVRSGRPPETLARSTVDTVPILIDRPDNNVGVRARGIELTAMFAEIVPLKTRIAVQGAWSASRLEAVGLDFGTTFGEFQLNDRQQRAPYWENIVQRGERMLLTGRVIHHQPEAGLVITATLQYFLRESRVNEGGVDTLAFAGFITRSGSLVPVPIEARTATQYRDLALPRRGVFVDPRTGPRDWMINLQVSKSLPHEGRLAFYAFNAFDRLGRFGGQGTTARAFAAMRFGVELTMPFGLTWSTD